MFYVMSFSDLVKERLTSFWMIVSSLEFPGLYHDQMKDDLCILENGDAKKSRDGLIRFISSRTLHLIESLLEDFQIMVRQWTQHPAPLLLEQVLIGSRNDLLPRHAPDALESLLTAAMTRVTTVSGEVESAEGYFDRQKNEILELCRKRSATTESVLEPLQQFKTYLKLTSLFERALVPGMERRSKVKQILPQVTRS